MLTRRRQRFLLAILFATMGTIAVAAPQFPALTGRVVDQAKIIDAATANTLNGLLTKHEQATGNQVVVVTLNSLQDIPIEDYGYQLGRHWGIGQAKKNNGALILVAPNEREVRIEVGYGLEGQLTDAVSRFIIQTQMTPAFKTGDYAKGILDGTRAVIQAIEQPAALEEEMRAQAPQAPTDNQSVFGMLVFGGVLLGFILKLILPSWKGVLLAATLSALTVFAVLGTLAMALLAWVIVLVLLGMRDTGGVGPWRGGGFGGGRGGGFSGGGGSFGGGGASGRW